MVSNSFWPLCPSSGWSPVTPVRGRWRLGNGGPVKRRWIAVGACLAVVAAGVGAWRVWRDDLCDVPKVVTAPSVRLPAAAAGGHLDPPKPASDSDDRLLYDAVHYAGSRQLGRLRWAVHTDAKPPELTRLDVHADETVAIIDVARPFDFGTEVSEIAAYRLSDGKLLWRLKDARLGGPPGLYGRTVVISRHTAEPDDDRRSVDIGLDTRTGKVRWCHPLGGVKSLVDSQPDSPTMPHERLVAEWGPGDPVKLADADTGETVTRIRLPAVFQHHDGPAPALETGWGKLVARAGNTVRVYRLADGKLLYHVDDVPHPALGTRPPLKKGEDEGRPFIRASVLAPNRVLVQSVVYRQRGNGIYEHDSVRSLITAYDDSGNPVWQRPGGDRTVPMRYELDKFDNAVVVSREGSIEARRLSDGKRLWIHGDPKEGLSSPLYAAGTHLYSIFPALGDKWSTVYAPVTAIDKATGKLTRLSLSGSLTKGGDPLLRGRSDVVLLGDLHTVAVFDAPA